MKVYIFSSSLLLSTDFKNHVKIPVKKQEHSFKIHNIPKEELLIEPKLLRKIDPFSAYTILCVRNILKDYSYDPLTSGIFVGNMLGGWRFGYKELSNLHNKGFSRFSPYQATAWFPAAAQGEASIYYNLLGSSKTFSGGLFCGLEALEAAIINLKNNRIKVAVAGVSESIDHEFGITGALDFISNGDIVGEGGAFLGLTTQPFKGLPLIEIMVNQKKTTKKIKKLDSKNAVNFLSISPIISILNTLKTFTKMEETLVFRDEKRAFLVQLRKLNK